MSGVTYEFECEKHGMFEVFFCPVGIKFYNCPKCDDTTPCERVWSIPQMGTWSASLWNTVYGDRTTLNENLKRTNRFIKEPGTENDTKENEKRYIAKKTKQLEDKVDHFIKDRTLDELRSAIKVDAAILDAQSKGDKGRLHQLGVPMNVEKMAGDAIKKAPPVVKPAYKSRRINGRTN